MPRIKPGNMADLLTQLEDVDIRAAVGTTGIGADDQIGQAIAGQVLADGKLILVVGSITAD